MRESGSQVTQPDMFSVHGPAGPGEHRVLPALRPKAVDQHGEESTKNKGTAQNAEPAADNVTPHSA